jgi:hypothetical protein
MIIWDILWNNLGKACFVLSRAAHRCPIAWWTILNILMVALELTTEWNLWRKLSWSNHDGKPDGISYGGLSASKVPGDGDFQWPVTRTMAMATDMVAGQIVAHRPFWNGTSHLNKLLNIAAKWSFATTFQEIIYISQGGGRRKWIVGRFGRLILVGP